MGYDISFTMDLGIMKLKMPISQNCISTIYTSDKYLWRGILDLINLKTTSGGSKSAGFIIVYICNGDPIITWGMVKVPLAGLTLPHFVPVPSQDLNLKVAYHCLFLCSKNWKWEVVRFVGICGIVDHHSLKFLKIVQIL